MSILSLFFGGIPIPYTKSPYFFACTHTTPLMDVGCIVIAIITQINNKKLLPNLNISDQYLIGHFTSLALAARESCATNFVNSRSEFYFRQIVQ